MSTIKFKTMTYTFNRQLRIGKVAEDLVQNWLGQHNFVVEADRADQYRGIDFWFRSNKNEDYESVEVKLDTYASKNGNYYLELELPNKPGFVYTCEADYIILCIGFEGDAVVLRPQKLRDNIDRWKRAYKKKTCMNKNNYWSVGLVTPVSAIEIHGTRINLRDEARNIKDLIK